jgi:hypothetical protein
LRLLPASFISLSPYPFPFPIMSSFNSPSFHKRALQFLLALKTGNDIQSTLHRIYSVLANEHAFLTSYEHRLNDLVATYSDIGRILNVPFPLCVISKDDKGISIRSVRTATFMEILNAIGEKDVHQNVDMGNGNTCSCSYHLETLLSHLISASIVAGLRALDTGCSTHLVLMSVFTALMHDIGKPACVKAFGKHIGYPLHGEIGAQMFLRGYSSKMSGFFSRNEWELMAHVITVHMCSYHVSDFSDEWDVQRVKSVAHLPLLAKRLLKVLSYGDTFGKISAEEHDDDSAVFLTSRQEWTRLIMPPTELDTNKLTIFVNGRSHSGKSTIAQEVTTFCTSYGKSVGYVARDIILCSVVFQRVGAELKKTGFSAPAKGERPTGAFYGACYELYEKHKLGGVVNGEMQKAISASIAVNDITIIDTQATMFQGVERIIPATVEKTIRISMLCSANFETPLDDKNGVDVQKQLTMAGEMDLLFPMDLSGVDTIALQSAYCNSKMPTYFSPQFVFPLVSTAEFKGAETLGLSTAFSLMRQLFQQIASTPTSAFVDVDKLLIGDYIRHYYRKFRGDFDKLCEHFRAQAYKAHAPHELRDDAEFKDVLFHLKYLEHNKIWTPWARGARGTGMMKMRNGHMKMIKMLLQRGAEVLTGQQVKRGFTETENTSVADSSASYLSQELQELIDDLLHNRAVDLVASFKKDGSLLSFARYTGETATIFRTIVNQFCDKFTKTVMQVWDEVCGHQDEVLLMMSQGTFWLGPDMQDYNTSAIFPELCGQTPRLSPTQKIRIGGPALFQRLRGFFSKLKGDHQIAVFETICKNRTTDAGLVHTELAVSYSDSSATLLSATELYHADDAPQEYVYLPHYKISDVIAENGFIEPAFWRVKSTEEMDQLVRSVGDIIYRRITVNEFYERHPPANVHGFMMVIDYEGFVVYDVARDDSYAKIKTDEYYICHKFREGNVSKLIALADFAGHIFPLARLVKGSFQSFGPACLEICSALARYVEHDSDLHSLLPEKARTSLDKMKTVEQKYKVIINNCRKAVGAFGTKLFLEHFPSLKEVNKEKFDISSFVIGFAMQTKIWEPKDHTSEVIDDKSRQALVSALFS